MKNEKLVYKPPSLQDRRVN